MANRTWSSAASTDMNDTANYSGAGSFATDDLIFDNTSVINSAATAGITANSITIASNYTGTWSLSGQTATLAQGFSDNGITGAHNYGNGITCGGASATFHVGSGVGTITATSCALAMNGTTGMTLDDDKGITIKSLTLGASAIVTSSSGAQTKIAGSSTLVTLGANASFTNNSASTFVLQVSANMTIFSLGAGYTWTGSCATYIAPTVTGLTITIPAFTMGGTAGLIIYDGNTSLDQTVTLSGALNIGGNLSIYKVNSTGAKALTFNTDNFNVTCAAFSFGAANTATTLLTNNTFNFGSSTITCTSVNCHNTYNQGTTNFNFGSSQWLVSGSWTNGSTTLLVSEGTSSVTFSGTGATNTVTSSGKKFYDVTINKTATAGVTFADAASLHTLTASGTNTQAISWTGSTMTASGDITLDGSGTHVFGNGITLTGASSNFHIGSTLTAPTASSCALTFNGTTACVFDDDKGTSFKTLTLGASAVVTSSGLATTILQSTTGPLLTLGANSSFTVNTTLTYRPFTTMTVMSIGAGVTFNGTAAQNLLAGGANQTFTVPAITYTGSGTLTITDDANHLDGMTVTLSGSLSWGPTASLVINSVTAALARTFTFNTGNYSVTCGAFSTGSPSANSVLNANYGSSAVSVSSFTSATTNVGVSNLAFQTSTWSCSGAWTFGTNSVITGTAATTSVTFTNTSTITSNAKIFPGSIILNAAGKIFTLASALSVAGNLTVTAGTLAGAFTSTCAGNVTIMVATTFDRLILTKVATRRVTVNAGITLTLTNLTNTNVNGAAGALTEWRSFVPGVTYSLSVPAPITLQYQNPQDCVASALITATDYTSADGGNNTNWLFPAAGAPGYMKYW